MHPTLTEAEKTHKVLEGFAPCCKCGEFWEHPQATIDVHMPAGDVQRWCLFCYIQELKVDLEEIKCKSQRNVSGALSLGTATDLSPMSYLTLLESMFGYRTRERLRNVKASQP